MKYISLTKALLLSISSLLKKQMRGGGKCFSLSLSLFSLSCPSTQSRNNFQPSEEEEEMLSVNNAAKCRRTSIEPVFPSLVPSYLIQLRHCSHRVEPFPFRVRGEKNFPLDEDLTSGKR